MAQGLPRWVRPALLLSVSLILMGAAGLVWLNATATGAAALPRYGAMPDFRLVDHAGRTVTRADVAGKVLAVGFIYTSCPDICPMLTAQMKGLQDDVKAAGLTDDVLFLSISVDPERDSPSVLAQYAAGHGADLATWRFLTGETARVKLLVEEGFLVGMNKASAVHDHNGTTPTVAEPYEVSHSGRIVLVDRTGQLRAYHEGTELDPARVLADIQRLR